MSSWFSRSKKPPGGAASGGNEGYNVPDDDSVGDSDEDEGHAQHTTNNNNNHQIIGQQILNDFTTPDEEYDPDFEADLARAISESLSIKQNVKDESPMSPGSRYKNNNNNNLSLIHI